MFSRAKLIITAVAISLLFAGSGEAKTMPPGFFGVLPQEALHKQDYDIMQFIGMETIRIPMSWGVVEGTRGTYDWGAYDAAVRSASERDINLFVTLYSSPGWVGDYRILPVRGDASKRWKRFVHAAVSRYGANGNYWFENPDVPYNPVDEWQIWNEVNYKYFSLPVSARNYGILVRDTAPVIRRADSNSKVILSGLYSKPGRGDGIPAGAFLAQASRIKGFARSYDAASIHPYTITPTIAMNQIWVFRKTMNLLARTYKTKRVRIVKRVRGKRKVVFKKGYIR